MNAASSSNTTAHYALAMTTAAEPAAEPTRLERIISLALKAQALAMKDDASAVASHLASADPEFVGFAIEGSSMGLFMLDHRSPLPDGSARLDMVRVGPWARYSALRYAGVGLACGELGLAVDEYVAGESDLMAAFAVDGYAFHFGFVAPSEHFAGQPWPLGVSGGVGRLFDVGLARSLWFSYGADPGPVANGVGAFPDDRQGDLWAGIGFAATYAGGLTDDGYATLRDGAGARRAFLATGSAFAAHVRVQCDNLFPAIGRACEELAGRSAAEADELCLAAQAAVPASAGAGTSLPAFLAWRDRITESIR
jgi:hypothetical protein